MPIDLWPQPFKTLVILGESTVQGGGWLERPEDRFADVLVRLINTCQEEPITYHNKGIGANVISPRSPGYAASARPSALERYRDDVIALRPDLFILCYGLNDMRAGMDVDEFREDLATIITDVQAACAPLTVLTTVYHMTAWRSYPPFDRGSREATIAYNQAIERLGREHGCLVSHVWESEGEADWLIHPDGVHANLVGNLVLAHRIFEDLATHCSGLSRATFARAAGTDWTRHTTQARAEAGDPFVVSQSISPRAM
jgi:lysophospholipase L1-like esterase